MILRLHDDQANSLVAAISDIDYDYQAELWIIDTHDDRRACDPGQGNWVVRWILSDDEGERAVWERKPSDSKMPELVRAAERFAGVRPTGNR